MGKNLIVIGALIVALGLLVSLGERIGFPLGRLPGDIRIEGKNGGFYFPVTSCILVSLLLSAVGWLLRSR